MRYNRTRRLSIEALEAREVLSTFFVATNGNDAGAGSAAAPWLTLQHAVDSIKPGDTILVQSGTYAGCRIGNSGTAAAPCTLQAAPGAKVVINAPGAANRHSSDLEVENFSSTVSNWIIDGFEVTNAPRYGIDVRVTDAITIRNCYVHNSALTGIFFAFSDHQLVTGNQSAFNGEHGIYDSNSGDFGVFRGNSLHDNHSAGIHLNGDISQGGDGIISGVLIENNVIFNNGVGGGSGINCDGVQNSTIRNNLLYNNHASGISLYRIDAGGSAINNLVINNTIDMAADARWALNVQDASTGNTVLNNVLYNNHSFHGSIDVSADSLPGFTSDYNVVMDRFTTDGGNSILTLAQWQSATGQDRHSFVATPTALFVNAAANDFHLTATSPAIDTGTSSQAPATDLEGKPRPSGKGFDVGAYEFQFTATPTPVANNDAYSVAAGTSLTVTSPGVLANDTDPSGLPLSAALVQGPVHGGLTFNANGSFTYTPATGFSGVDSFTYQASDGQGVSNLATVTITVMAPPAVQSVVINDGSAQRSMVTSITVTFNEKVTLPSNPAAAFQLVGPNGAVAVQVALSLDATGTRTVAKLTFSGPNVINGSLADGRYSLTILSSQVHDANGQALDGDKNGVAGGDAVSGFFRLFGDSNGDGKVNTKDRTAFYAALGTLPGQAGYVWYFDYDGLNGVDRTVDLVQFRKRLGTSI
jgi:hypothetical protein